MQTQMTTEEQRILNTVEAFNPLHNSDFQREVGQSFLKFDEENLPRVYQHMRTVTEIWRAKDTDGGSIKALENSRAAEPNLHGLIADSVHLLKEGRDPDWHRVRVVAENCMHAIRHQFRKEKGRKELDAVTRTEYLRAIEQLAQTGFSPESLIHLAYISGLAKALRA
jgi:hypothetical protein